MTSKFISKLALKAAILFVAFLQCSCEDFLHPIASTDTPSEYQYNYWLLQRQYLFEDELDRLEPEGDSAKTLYEKLDDPFTRYVPPSKSEATSITLNTSIVQGDVGMEYYLINTEHPLFIYRVYPDGPAGRANVPRYGNIIDVNGVDVRSYNVYDSVLTHSKDVKITVVHNSDTLLFDLTKEDIYAPTVFLDTLAGIEFITIKSFKPNTADKERGTYGELKKLLDSIKDHKTPRVLDLRGNPGGHVDQCVSMADLFIKSGNISTRTWRSLQPDGSSKKVTRTTTATPGDPGEDSPFVLLVNKNSASCAEIFTAAVAEAADAPVIGEPSYGKGIGQSTWNTLAGGLAIITNLEFLTPKGNSYHKKGIIPDYACDGGVSAQCAIDVVLKIYGNVNQNSLKKSSAKIYNESVILDRAIPAFGGAILQGN